jgi:SUKH-4 immunity protein
MDVHRYSAKYVEIVADTAARDFLVGVGLPAVPGVFAPAEPPSDRAFGNEATGVLLRIDDGTEGGGFFGVGCLHGEIIYVAEFNSRRFYVNSSPELFARCLEAFHDHVLRCPDAGDRTELEGISDSLSKIIEGIDPSAMRDDPGFWHSLLFDVANGDYCDG